MPAAVESRPKGFARSSPSTAFDQYLHDIQKLPLITDVEEERRLARRAQGGDERAAERLVTANLRFVISYVKKYQGHGLDLSELVAIGNEGLLKAVRKFDPDQGVKFISYAVWWVRQAVLKALAEQTRSVRIPLNQNSQLIKLSRAETVLAQVLKRDPTDNELGRLLEETPDTVRASRQMSATEISLDAPIDRSDREASTLGERFAGVDGGEIEEVTDFKLMRESIDRAFKKYLTPRERKILYLYYGLGQDSEAMTLEKIGSLLGVTRERIRQIRERAFEKLRQSPDGGALSGFWALRNPHCLKVQTRARRSGPRFILPHVIPAFVNEAAGTAPAAMRALEETGGFEIHALAPDALEGGIRSEMASRPKRIVIAGGDGSVGTAARVLCGTDTALAVLPGGTLNHFARDHGIPVDLPEAAATAVDGDIGTADVAYADDSLFLNTSSVGAYVAYVRLRNRAERYVGYRIASLLAAVRMFVSMRSVALELDVEGERRSYSTPIVFIGVGERETRSPTLGNRIPGGKQCLHVIVVRERRAARLLVVALDAATRGLDKLAHTPELDSFMVDSCTIKMGGRQHHVAVDGEIVALGMPLQYRLLKDSLRIVVPAEQARSGT